MLETKAKGVRDQIAVVQQVLAVAPEMGEELRESINDGFKRRPDWPALHKGKSWLEL
jgi:hypothetical protein